jgi:hypothetical protein
LQTKFDGSITSDSLIGTINSQGKEYFRAVAIRVLHMSQKILHAQIFQIPLTLCHFRTLQPYTFSVCHFGFSSVANKKLESFIKVSVLKHLEYDNRQIHPVGLFTVGQ